MTDPTLPSEERPIPWGRYQLVELIGEGAMAQVFRARQSGPMGFSKEVALKRLRTAAKPRDRKEIEALVNEARLGGQLRHPNIVEIYGCDVHEGTFFLAMEYVRGWLLDDVLWRLLEAGEHLPPAAIVDILRQVAHGLAYAHEATDEAGAPMRLVHRDLKPQNIFLDRSGVVKIADFGLAKSTTNLYQTTDADETKGSPLYMSPEQIGGSTLDSRSDLFALGTITIELVTGLRAFEGSSIPNTLMKVLNVECEEAMAALQAQMPALVPIVGRLLRPHPAERYQTAREVGADLDRLAADAATGTHTRALVGALLGEDAVGLPETIKLPYRQLSDRLKSAGALEIERGAPRRAPPGPGWKEPRGSQSVVETRGGTKELPERRAERRKRKQLKRAASMGALLILAIGITITAVVLATRLDLGGDPGYAPEDVVGASDPLDAAPPPPVATAPPRMHRAGPAIHVPVASARAGAPLSIVVQMTEAGDLGASVFWRPVGGEFAPLPMTSDDGMRFATELILLPEYGGAVEYYVDVVAGDETYALGSAAEPFRVATLPP